MQSCMQADRKPDHKIELPVLVEILFQVTREKFFMILTVNLKN
jgi:hypothetical protein